MPTTISGLNGIDNVAPNTIQTGDIQNDAVLLANLTPSVRGKIGFTGDKNRVINGSMQIVNQATFVASNNTAGYGGPEMFLASNQGAGGQFTQSQGSLTFGGISLPTVRQTVNTPLTNLTAGTHWGGLRHRFEGFNLFDLRGKPVAVSFVFNTNVTGTYSVGLVTIAGTQYSYLTTINAVANTPIQVTIPISAIPLESTINNDNALALELGIGFLNTGTFQTGTLNAWQVGAFYSATGATNWGATAGNFIELTNLQLEEGTVATEFVRRSIAHELMLTQRYFGFVLGYYRRYDDTITASNTDGGMVHYPVNPRTVPTVNLTLSGTNSSGLGVVAIALDRVLFIFGWVNLPATARDVNVTGTYSARL